MELVAILFLLGVGGAIKGAWDHIQADARVSRAAKVKAATKAAGGSLPKSQRRAVVRRHTIGWWAREVGGGFPAARTGWHAGWIAHKTAVDRQQVIREEARTEHIETKAGFRKDLAEHQRRQAKARAEIEQALADAPDQPKGRKAVQSAADEVARKRAEKQQREHGVPPLPADTVGAPDPVSSDISSGEWWDAAGLSEPAVTDTPAHAHLTEDSDWLRPGEPRCEGCGGRGSWQGATCPACRGFGSAPADPNSSVAADGAICGACGHGQRPDDPVLATAGGYDIHRSHATEQQAGYQDALGRMRHAENEPGPDAARNPQPINGSPASPTTTEGAPMPADTNYAAVLANAKAAADQAEQDAIAATQRRVIAENHADAMQGANVQGNCLSAQMDLVDRLRVQEEAAKASGEQAAAVSDHLQREHGGIQEAVDDAPIAQPAQPEFYAGS